MKVIQSVIFALLFFYPLMAQDSTFYVEEALQLIQEKKYATAHRLLEAAIQEVGFKPELVCTMVENALNNYFLHKDYEIFYLQDVTDWSNLPKDSLLNRRIVSLRYPDRILLKIIQIDPQNARAYKLLGDYYDLKLSDLTESDLIDERAVKAIEERIFKNYYRAVQLGYNDPNVNRWLGDYYKKLNQLNIAKEYYLRNVKSQFDDPITYFRLAEIYFHEKQYNQAYNYASLAIKGFDPEEIYMRYESLRLAALSLYNLGEEEGFLDYLDECIQLLPDRQDAYLDLINYYDQRHDVARVEELIRQMLFNNPYDLKGYQYLERFVIKYKDFLFGEKLFEDMILRYENSDEVMGNIYWFRGNLYFHQGMVEEARKLWGISRNYFMKYLPEDSPILKQIGNIDQKSSIR